MKYTIVIAALLGLISAKDVTDLVQADAMEGVDEPTIDNEKIANEENLEVETQLTTQ